MNLKMILYFTYESRGHFPLFLSVKAITKLILGQGETFEIKLNKLAFVVHVLQTSQNFSWSFHVVVLQRTAKKCTKNYNASAQPPFCSLNLLFSDAPVAAVVVYFHTYINFFNVSLYLADGKKTLY